MCEIGNDTHMQRIRVGFGLSLLSLGLFGGALWLGHFLTSVMEAIIISVLLFIPSIVYMCKSNRKKKCAFYSLLLNSVANGFVVAIYYLKIQKFPLPEDYLALCLPMALLLISYLLFAYLKKGRSWLCVLLLLLHVVLLSFAVVRWVRRDAAFYSVLFFALIFSMIYCFVFALLSKRATRSVLLGIGKGSFGILGLVTCVVIFLVTEGEGIDGAFEFMGDMISDVLPDRKKPKP